MGELGYDGYLGSAQDEWLVETRERLRRREDLAFVVVGFHSCMFCSNLDALHPCHRTSGRCGSSPTWSCGSMNG